MRPSINVSKVSRQVLETNPFGRDARIDSELRIPVRDNFFNLLELTNIKNTLYTTKQEEFVGAQIVTQTNEWQAGARQVGFDLLEPVGEARIGSQGAGANDIPFVAEKLKESYQNAVEIEIGIRYTRQEVEAAEAKSTIGRGANINLVNERAAMARRFISMAFDKGIFQGYANYGLKGFQSLMPGSRQSSLPTDNNTVQYEAVPATGSGSGDARRLWTNKTGLQIYQDLLRAKYEGVSRANIFQGDTLVVDTVAYSMLARPYSDLLGKTLLAYLKEEGLFKNIYQTNAVSVVNNGRNNTYFMVLDSSPEIMEIPILRPLTIFPSVTDFNQEVKQLVALRYAGVMVKYLGAIYFGDSHVETLV